MKRNILEYLKNFTEMQNTPLIPYAGFVEFLYQQAEANHDHVLVHAAHNDLQKLIPILENLERQNQCVLQRDNKWVKSIFLNQTAVRIISKEYEAIAEDNSRPFPNEGSLGFKLPEGSYIPLNIKERFIELINSPYSLELDIIKIIFPGDLGNIITTREVVDKHLVKATLDKISKFLSSQQNNTFISNRLTALLPGNNIAVKELLSAIIRDPATAMDTLSKPTDFSFKFWTHLANLILESLKTKQNKMAIEYSFCHATYIAGYYNMCQKGNIQKERQKKIDLEKIPLRLKKPPYAYTLQDIYGFIDKGGVPYIKKYSKKLIDEFLDEQSAFHQEKLPNIIRLRSSGSEYFVHKELLILLFIKNLSEASRKIKEDLKTQWLQSVRNFEKDRTMNEDSAFAMELEKRVKNGFPLLYTLMQFKLLYMAKQETKTTDNIRNIINRCFDEKHQLRPVHILLDLDRRSIYHEMKYRLPFYYSVPLLSMLVYFMQWVTGKRSRRKKDTSAVSQQAGFSQDEHMTSSPSPGRDYSPDGNSSKAAISNSDYINAIRKLEKKITGDGRAQDSLKGLEKKWNPLLDEKAKANLTEDVNALIRDFLRKLRKGFRAKPPDAERIHALATDLANSRNLKEIKRKEYLIRYIEIYMIKSLNKEG